MGGADIGKGGQGFRGVIMAHLSIMGAGPGEGNCVMVQLAEVCNPILFKGGQMVIGGLCKGLARGLNNRAVPCTAAQVPREGIIDAVQVIAAAGPQMGEHGHDKSRCAKTALGPVQVNQSLLHRMERPVRL